MRRDDTADADRAWMAAAACRANPHPDAWFPPRGNATANANADTILICLACPVRANNAPTTPTNTTRSTASGAA